MADDCEFCKIIAGDVPAYRVYTDANTVAFLDKNPATRGHTIVSPRDHVRELLTAGQPTVRAVFETVRTVAETIEAALDPSGFSVFHTTAGLVGTVRHAHVHVVPRYPDDDVHIALDRTRIRDGQALLDRLRPVE